MNNARDLTQHLAELLRRERGAMAEFLVALAAFDRERRWIELGHASLFSFLHRELGLAKDSAFLRMTAAEVIQKYPEVVAPLRDGRLSLSTLVEVAKVITLENRRGVLPRYFHLSKREAKVVTAELAPCEAAPQRTVVTPLPVVPALSLAAFRPDPVVRPDEPDLTLAVESPPRSPSASLSSAPPPPPRPPPAEVVPLTADLSRMHVTVSRGFLEKLAKAKAALSHAFPDGDEEQILERGLDLVLAEHAKKKGLVENPRKVPRPSKGDAIPAHVKRAVWRRAGGRCECRLGSGEVCGSTDRLEFDHFPIPKAQGGPATEENVRLACKPHNIHHARKVYGDAWMDRYTRTGAKPVPDARPPP